MKLNKWIYGITAVGMLAACSSDEVPSNGGGEIISHDGKYMAISINLPTVASTRALNDVFDDGTASEYTVNTACLVIFSGKSESDATFAAAYALSGLAEVDDAGEDPVDQLTTSYRKSVRLDNLKTSDGDNLYAFVMLNYIGVVDVTPTNGLKVNDVDITNEDTFANVFLQTTKSSFTEYGFFMCNSPLSVNPGGSDNPADGGANIITLVEIASDKIFASEDDANRDNNEACSVNVERGVAKATIAWDPNGFSDTSTVGSKNEGVAIAFSDISWALDVTESSSYIARNAQSSHDWWGFANSNTKVPSSGKYRFVGNTKVGTTLIQPEQDLYRTYWCVDPHYNNSDDLVKEGSTDYAPPTSFAKESEPLYCYENTFDVAHQNYRNTTRAVFKVTLQIGDAEGDFYVLNGDESTLYTNKEDVESYPIQAILVSTKVVEALNNAVSEGKTWNQNDAKALLDITFKRNESTGVREVTDISFKDLTTLEDQTIAAKFESAPTLIDDDKKDVIANANAIYVISEYENGECYYELRFMHFASESTGSDLAPWSSNVEIASTTSNAYPGSDAEKEWLGRYGMVRNNWYDVEVTSVKSLGSPVVPDITGSRGDTSDDSKENYFSFKINVMSWAKRTQTHEF